MCPVCRWKLPFNNICPNKEWNALWNNPQQWGKYLCIYLYFSSTKRHPFLNFYKIALLNKKHRRRRFHWLVLGGCQRKNRTLSLSGSVLEVLTLSSRQFSSQHLALSLSHGPLKYLTYLIARGLIEPSKKTTFLEQRRFPRWEVQRTPLLHAYLKPLMSKFFVVRKEPSLAVQMNREFPKMKKKILTYQRAH